MTNTHQPIVASADNEAQWALLKMAYTGVTAGNPNAIPWDKRTPEWKIQYDNEVYQAIAAVTDGSKIRADRPDPARTRVTISYYNTFTVDELTALKDTYRKDKNGVLDTAPLANNSDNVPDYSASLNKLGIAMSALEEGLPNGQMHRVQFALEALFDGATDLSKWVNLKRSQHYAREAVNLLNNQLDHQSAV